MVLVFDDRLHEIRPTNRQIDRYHRPGADTDHDGGRGAQCLQKRSGVSRVRGDVADRLTARPRIAPAVVKDHLSDPREFADRRTPGGRRRPGRMDQQDRCAFAHVVEVQVAAVDDDPRALGLQPGTLPGGKYVRVRLKGEPPAVHDLIPKTMQSLANRPDRDPVRPQLEFYRRRDEIDLLVPVLPSS